MKKKIFFLLFLCLFITGEGYVFWKYFYPQYRIELMSDISHFVPHEPNVLSFRIQGNQGEVMKNFSITHEKIMHLILIRKDLQEFQHLHPAFNSKTGDFEVSATIASSGSYRVFADFALEEPGHQSPLTLFQDTTIGLENEYVPLPVFPEESWEKNIEDGYTVTFLKPEMIVANTPLSYSLRVEKNGKEVSDFEPYLGVMGHSVILKKDTLDFIHTHAESSAPKSVHAEHHSTESVPSNAGISFMTSFPLPGLYKIFVQFKHEGNVRTVDFVVEVRQE